MKVKKKKNNKLALSLNSKSSNFMNLIDEGNNNNFSGSGNKKMIRDFEYEDVGFYSQNSLNSKIQKNSSNIKRFEDFLEN